MEVQSINPSIFKADSKSHLLSSDSEKFVLEQVAQRLYKEETRVDVNFGLDLDLPHPDTYLPETVDFPSSPSAMIKFRSQDREEDVVAGDEATSQPNKLNDAVLDSEDEQSFRAVIDHNSVRLRKDELPDSANASDNDEYYEDFHLPLTHQNSMSTRRSFIRKVKSVEIRVPDADRIEGIVKSGELNRHGSIRRKIVPQPQDFVNDSFHSEKEESPIKFTSTPNDTLTDLAFSDSIITTCHGAALDVPFEDHCLNGESYKVDLVVEENPTDLLDEITLTKIRDCLDTEKVKDIYTLGSRLQDLLSPSEIEEIVLNSHRYHSVISKDVLQALSESLQEKHDRSKRRNHFIFPVKGDFGNSEAPPDIIDNNDTRRPDNLPKSQQRTKKRISVMDDILSSQADSDNDIEKPSPDSSSVTSKNPANKATDNGPQSSSESVSALTPNELWEGLATPDDVETPDDLDNSIMERMPRPDLIPEVSAKEEREEERHWRSVVIAGLERKIDMKVIEPYKKVLSHGGYHGEGCQTAIIAFSACFLPDRSRVDYDYVMEHLFLYVLTTLDQLVAEDYVLIYFHGATPKSCIPRFSWLKNCYQMIDRRLRKNLKRLYLVHPTLWLKAAVLMCRPFISAKFSRKLIYVPNLTSLSTLLPMDHVCIPDRVKQLEFRLMIQELKRRKGIR